jgi:uncharacterized protein (TIGR01244 family)
MKQVTDKFWVAPQISQADIDDAAAHGIRTIINNRPDGEDPGQPAAAAHAEAARAHGMDYQHIPVVGGSLGRAQIDAFRKALAEAPGPVLAHCRSGTRSLVLYTIGEVLDGRMQPSEIDALGQRMGIDLTGAKVWLANNR